MLTPVGLDDNQIIALDLVRFLYHDYSLVVVFYNFYLLIDCPFLILFI